jgi:uncharacterized protein (DUF427 family)
MSLTTGTGPFSPEPGGVSNFDRNGPDQVLYLEDYPRRVRALFAGETVADSTRVQLLHETGLQPVYYFPPDDVRTDLLEPADRHTHCPVKGDASYWTVRVGDRVADHAVWSYPEPLDGCPPVAGRYAFYWTAMDAWFEEDEEVFVHPRNPYTRIEVLPSSRPVRVELDGQGLAKSNRPLLLFETGLVTRCYLPADDVRTDLLEPSETTSRCPYKGVASYWSVRGAGEAGRDLVWSYAEPRAEAAAIAGRLAFYSERAAVTLGGERL